MAFVRRIRGSTSMKLVLVLLALLVVSAYCNLLIFCPNGESDIFDCLDYFMDENHDGKLFLGNSTAVAFGGALPLQTFGLATCDNVLWASAASFFNVTPTNPVTLGPRIPYMGGTPPLTLSFGASFVDDAQC